MTIIAAVAAVALAVVVVAYGRRPGLLAITVVAVAAVTTLPVRLV